MVNHGSYDNPTKQPMACPQRSGMGVICEFFYNGQHYIMFVLLIIIILGTYYGMYIIEVGFIGDINTVMDKGYKRCHRLDTIIL